MKNGIALVGALLLAATSLTGCRIMVVGDAFATGGGVGQFTWRYRLVQHLDASLPNCEDAPGAGILDCYDMVGPREFAILEPQNPPVGPWDRSHGASAQWDDGALGGGNGPTFDPGLVATIQQNVATHRPHAIVVQAGYYDMAIWQRSAAQTYNLVKQFIDNARAGGNVIFFKVMKLTLTGHGPTDAKITQFNNLLNGLAAEKSVPGSNVAVVSSHLNTFNHTQHTTQAFGSTVPNVAGEWIIAEAVANAIGLGGPF